MGCFNENNRCTLSIRNRNDTLETGFERLTRLQIDTSANLVGVASSVTEEMMAFNHEQPFQG